MRDYNHLLEGRKIFVTTGARGIGREIALLFAEQGAQVIVGGRNQEYLDKTIVEIQKHSPKSAGVLFDLGNGSETEAACDKILSMWDGIDILVNTVGINRHQRVDEADDAVISKTWETNYMSSLRCIRKFLPGMMERRRGNVINISSIHSVQTMPGFGIYAGTKGAVNATARAMALDYAPYGIRVNTICPGLIMSDNMVDEIETYPQGRERDDFMKLLYAMQPLEPGTMEDIANAALYLASDMSGYVTGQILMVDGGASIKAH